MPDNTQDLDKLSARLRKIAREFPEKQRTMHEKLGQTLLKTVRGNVPRREKKPTGRIAGYQRLYVGSKGGYAAVRPQSGISGKNSPGAITVAVDSGHRIRRPKGRSKRKYRMRVDVPYVDGRHFYDTSREKAPQALQKTAAALADEIARELNKAL